MALGVEMLHAEGRLRAKGRRAAMQGEQLRWEQELSSAQRECRTAHEEQKRDEPRRERGSLPLTALPPAHRGSRWHSLLFPGPNKRFHRSNKRIVAVTDSPR